MAFFMPSSRTWRDGQVIQEKITVSSSLRLTAIENDVSLPALDDAKRTVFRRLRERGIGRLQYYNGDVHRALMALPNFYRACCPESRTLGADRTPNWANAEPGRGVQIEAETGAAGSGTPPGPAW